MVDGHCRYGGRKMVDGYCDFYQGWWTDTLDMVDGTVHHVE
jgi:hypothetical protein